MTSEAASAEATTTETTVQVTKKRGPWHWVALILGILVVIIGVTYIFMPYDAYIMLSWLLPFGIMFYGISRISAYCSSTTEAKVTGWVLAEGILSTILAFFFLINPILTLTTIPYIFGFWILFGGLMRIISSFALKGVTKGWYWFIILGVLGIAAGVLLLLYPVVGAGIVTYMTVCIIILMGIQSIAAFFINE